MAYWGARPTDNDDCSFDGIGARICLLKRGVIEHQYRGGAFVGTVSWP
ncbi:MAG: hypothetical protein GY898_25835 [Proteobacteria bacterium]|nr:hypothetical protein [Pseudomonadota bacterium]